MSVAAALRGAVPEAAKDLRLNLERLLEEETLAAPVRYGVALAAAYASRSEVLRAQVLEAGADLLTPELIEDARAAAAIMGMNNVYYRFRHFLQDKEYARLPARLRMNRLAQPATTKATLELLSLAVSAINGCELCVVSHEQVLRQEGLSADEVHAAARIAAVIHGLAVALELG